MCRMDCNRRSAGDLTQWASAGTLSAARRRRGRSRFRLRGGGSIGLRAASLGGLGIGSDSNPRKAEPDNEAPASLASRFQEGPAPRSAHAPVDERAGARPGDPDAFVADGDVGADGLLDP